MRYNGDMNQVLTISCKLKVSESQSVKLDATLDAFVQALNWVNQNTPEKIVNAVKLQSLCYYEVRSRFGLSSNLAQQVCRRVAGSRNIQICLESEPSEPQDGDEVLGVDLGRTDIAHTSEGQHWDGQDITKVRDHFHQLRLFIEYKALGAGIRVHPINPRYTSQTCHQCLHIHPDPDKSYRSGKRFKCEYCGWHGDADFNGAKNIQSIGLLVNQPGGSWLSCEIAGGLQKARALCLA